MTEDMLTAEVVSRFQNCPNPRTRQIAQALVQHLHAFARDVRLKDDEWMAGIQFLTAAGHITDAVRQEFILLSDTMGLSSLVDLINHSTGGEGSEPTILGPFYVPNSPLRAFGSSMIEFEDGGEKSIVSGRVMTVEGHPIPGALLDVWQNAANGFYAVQQPGVQPSGNLRGIYVTDTEGRFEFQTVRPVPYPIPDDGPVGQMLKSTGRHPWRCAHIHFKISGAGFAALTSHLFDADSEYLDSDTVFGVKQSLIRPFVRDPNGPTRCLVDFVLRRIHA